MVRKDVKKYLVFAVILILAVICYLIIKPFISALLTSFVLAYLFFPLHKKLKLLVRNETISALLITLLILLLILVPIVTIANVVVKESIELKNSGVIEEGISKASLYLGEESSYSSIIKKGIDKFILYIKEQASDFLLSLPSKLFEFLVTIYATFAFLLVGEKFVRKFKATLPVKKKEELIENIGSTTYSIVYGLFVTAIIEFIIALIAFKIMGSEIALLLALIIGFLAFIPLVGPGIIWVPYAIIEAIRGNTYNTIIIIVIGLILFAIETFLRPKIIGDRAKLHPVIIFIGTIGGIKLIGFIGIVLGPVILSAAALIIEEYYPEKNET